MFRGIMVKIRRAAIRLALNQPAPDRIPLIGDSTSQRNYYTAYLEEADDRWRFLVQEIQDGGVSGLWRDDSREILAVSVPNQTILTFGLQLIRYLKAEEFHYSSATWFLLTQYIGFPWLQLLYRRLRRFILNLRPLTRIDRTRVLQSYVEKSLSSDESRMSSVALMTMLYGPRWAHHPDNDRLRRYYEIVLESLAQTGELTHDGHAYRLAAQGFATLTQYEENAQRYRDMVRMQWLLAALTLGLVFVGLIQAAITYLGQD